MFGDGEQFTHFMGGYFYLKVVPDTGLCFRRIARRFLPFLDGWRC